MNEEPKRPARRIRRRLLLLAVVLLLYIGSYIPLSLTGGYIVNESGRVRPFTLAWADQYLWLPRYGLCQRFRSVRGRDTIRADFLGYVYCPLILIDQKFFHPTIRFMNEDMTDVEPFPVPPLERYHPTKQNPFYGRFPYRPVTNATERSSGQKDPNNCENLAKGEPSEADQGNHQPD